MRSYMPCRPRWCLLLVMSLVLPTCKAVAGTTFAEVKKTYLGKKVVMIGPQVWHTAEQQGDHFVESEFPFLPVSYSGQTATVVTVQLNGPRREGKTNALGEPINEDSVIEPRVDIVVRFDDGRYGMLTAYPATARISLRFVEEQQALAELISKNQASIIGANLYACEYSHLYEPDSTLEEMTGNSEIIKRLKFPRAPLLKPLKVTAAKYFAANEVVILKLQLPDGTDALAVSDMTVPPHKDDAGHSGPLDRVAGFFLTGIPKDFTPKEIQAIQKAEIFRGMDREAVECTLGFPKKENDWGRGGVQLVFSDTFIVYLNHGDRVEDWQSLGR